MYFYTLGSNAFKNNYTDLLKNSDNVLNLLKNNDNDAVKNKIVVDLKMIRMMDVNDNGASEIK